MPSSPLNRIDTHWPAPPTQGDAPPIDPREVVTFADAWRKRVEKFLGDHPQATIAVAAAAGVALGWFVKRK